MPILKKWRKDNGFFGIWKITETAVALRNRLKADFPYDQELGELKSESRKLEYLATRLMLKSLCKEEKQVGHYASGKPYLLDGSYKISISHTKGYVAVGIHATEELGIDIEYMSDRVQKIAERFLHNIELRFVGLGKTQDGRPDEEDVKRMLQFWSGKETFFKILSKSEVGFRENIILFPIAESTYWAVFHEKGLLKRLGQIYFAVNENFVCSWGVDIRSQSPIDKLNMVLPLDALEE